MKYLLLAFVGCKDIDDALHCTALPNGNFEVGVRILEPANTDILYVVTVLVIETYTKEIVSFLCCVSCHLQTLH